MIVVTSTMLAGVMDKFCPHIVTTQPLDTNHPNQ
jgi:hypothetical protein